MNEEIKDKVYLLPNIGTAQEFISELINVLEKEYETPTKLYRGGDKKI